MTTKGRSLRVAQLTLVIGNCNVRSTGETYALAMLAREMEG